MFIGKYKKDGKTYNYIYYGNINNHELWINDKKNGYDIETLDFKISGITYKDRKESLEELAIEWQLEFSKLSWSYSELAEIENYFYKNAKRYGLVKEFRENAIC